MELINENIKKAAISFLSELSHETEYMQDQYSLTEEAFLNLADAFRGQFGEDENGRTDEEIEELATMCENFEDPGLPVEGWDFLLGADVRIAYNLLQVARILEWHN